MKTTPPLLLVALLLSFPHRASAQPAEAPAAATPESDADEAPPAGDGPAPAEDADLGPEAAAKAADEGAEAEPADRPSDAETLELPEAPASAEEARREDEDRGAVHGIFEAPVTDAPESDPDPNAPAIDPEVPQTETARSDDPPKWYERIQLRGYTQFRYNRIPVPHMNDDLVNLQGDRSIGGGNGFSIRRLRLIFYGDLHDHLAFYIQPDLVSVAGGQMNSLVIRDAYADIFFDKRRRFRVRLGQSKVPYGFENMQSSQNRLGLDRNDAVNSAVKDERDIGAFFYYSSEEARARFKYLVANNLKGSGDYGVAGIGVYNGQTANKPALSDSLHVVARLAYPFLFGSQYVELGVGGYYGKYRVTLEDQDTTTFSTASGSRDITDARVAGSIIVYPQPFGFQAEVTYGVGPSLGARGTTERNVIDSRPLLGAYAQIMYKIDEPFGTRAMFPFIRGTYYDGGKKFFNNAPHYLVKELEIGLEWQIFRELEVVLAYDIVERTSDFYPYDQESGHVGRIQVQMNYP